MPSYKIPGVYYEEKTLQAATITGANLSAAAFLAPNPRGPVVPTLITSWSQYLQLFGGFATGFWLPYAVFQYFSNGGREAWIARVAGGGSVVAAKTFNDQAGTALPTLTVSANSPGAWGNTIYVEITNSGTDRFNLIVRYGGTSDANIVERWTDLSMTDTEARYAPNIINSRAGGSNYVTVADLASATAAPGDRPAPTPVTGTPAVAVPQALTGGTDTGTPDVAGGLTVFDSIDAPLNLNLPGNSTDVGAAITYAANRGDMFVVADPPQGATPDTTPVTGVVSVAGAYSASAYAAVYYPWIYIADPAGGTGATRLVPPGGAVLGQYAATDTTRGVYKTPAGLGNRISGALATERKLTSQNLGDLNGAGINAIRQIPGAGVVIMGGRTLKPNGSDKYISVRRSLIYIRSSLLTSTRFAVFEPNDTILWSTLQTVISRFLLDFWTAGGLRGNTPQEAFYVKCNDENNTDQSIQAGEVHVEIGVALQYPAEFIVMQLTQREVGAAVTVAA
jgi:uncharacterized protein